MSANTKLDRGLAMEMVRITEAAAIAAAKFVGAGEKENGDGAAVDAMRRVLKTVNINGTVIIGEGEKDEAPMLYNGEKVGSGNGTEVDIAVDPVEGTSLLARGEPNSIAVIALAEKGSMWNPGSSFYMNKIIVGEGARDVIDITKSPIENLHNVAKTLGKDINDLTVFVLDKKRHEGLIAEIRVAGAKVALHAEGDVMGALMAVIPDTGVDMLMGIGGTPEGVITAAAIKALGGGMQGMRAPQLAEEKEALKKERVDINQVLGLDDLIKSDDAFFVATGITEGVFLDGVNSDGEKGIYTHSIVMDALSSSMRYVKTFH